MIKLIILDRDGVINYDSNEFIKSPEEWIPYPDSLIALKLLKEAGFKVAIASNQSGIGRGLFSEEILVRIHTKMIQMVKTAGGEIDSIFYCPHHPDLNCLCRKPKPGLLWQIRDHYQIDLNKLPIVGDSWRDLEAALSVKATPILVKTGNGEKTYALHKNDLENNLVFDNLLHAVKFILATTSS